MNNHPPEANSLAETVEDLRAQVAQLRAARDVGMLRYGQPARPLALRQRVKSAELTSDVAINSTTLADVAGLSVSITTRGGRLVIYLVPSEDADAPDLSLYATDSGGAGLLCYAAAVVGASQLGVIAMGKTAAASGEVFPIAPNALRWEFTPPRGTYTVKIQARVEVVLGAASITFGGDSDGGLALVVEEWSE